MQYKKKKLDDNQECFEYQPNYIKGKNSKKQKRKKETGPFDKLSELRFR